LISKIIGTGEYWHRGIQNAFSDWNENLFDHNVEIDVFTDGFPIVKSSRLCGWPSFFTTPVDSMDVLGICFVKNQESELSVFSTDDIIAKYLNLPSLDGFVMTPILHNMQN
jgi:hypothetical protein